MDPSPGRVTFAVDGDAVGVVTLRRPAKRNALDVAAFEGLHHAAVAARRAAEDGTCRAVLVVGEGPAFCAGLDVALLAAQRGGAAFEEAAGGSAADGLTGEARSADPWIEEAAGGSAADGLTGEARSADPWIDDDRIAWLQQAFTGFEDLPVPVVAGIWGAAVGAGCQLALACHLRAVAPDARLGLAEVRWGLLPDLGGTYRLPRLVGQGRATDLALTGRSINAETALAWGLATRALDAGDPPAAAHALAAELAAGPTTALGAIPALVRGNLDRDRETALAAERAAQRPCLASADFAEAAAARAHRRPPRFPGR